MPVFTLLGMFDVMLGKALAPQQIGSCVIGHFEDAHIVAACDTIRVASKRFPARSYSDESGVPTLSADTTDWQRSHARAAVERTISNTALVCPGA